MNNVKVYVGISWIVSLFVTYGLGWWSGVKRATGVASDIGGMVFPVMLVAILLACIIVGFIAFRVGGSFGRGGNSAGKPPLN